MIDGKPHLPFILSFRWNILNYFRWSGKIVLRKGQVNKEIYKNNVSRAAFFVKGWRILDRPAYKSIFKYICEGQLDNLKGTQSLFSS